MKNSCVYNIILAVIMIGLLFLAYYNYVNNSDFSKTSLLAIMQIFILVVVSFIFVQQKTDTRKQADVVDSLIRKSLIAFEELNRLVGEYTNHVITDRDNSCCAEEREQIQEKIRLLENYFSSLKRPNVSDVFRRKFALIVQEFSDYTTQFENVFPGNSDNPSKAKEIKRLYSLLIAKLEDVSVEIYFPSKRNKSDNA